MTFGILGCGYTGGRLAALAQRAGQDVRCAVRSEARRDALRARGLDAQAVALDDRAGLERFAEGLTSVVHLVPPPPDVQIEAEVGRLAEAFGDVETFVYGSTTGAFGGVEGWIDETTPSGELASMGRARLTYETALADAGLPLRTVRIAGIYGPGRTIVSAIDRGTVLFEGGPPTSRIHVDDLVRILDAMRRLTAPRRVIACDEEPAPTLDVARHAFDLLGLELPSVLSLEEAQARMSARAVQLRLGGRRCRSIERPALIGPLLYPSYREGLVASLVEEGRLPPDSAPR